RDRASPRRTHFGGCTPRRNRASSKRPTGISRLQVRRGPPARKRTDVLAPACLIATSAGSRPCLRRSSPSSWWRSPAARLPPHTPTHHHLHPTHRPPPTPAAKVQANTIGPPLTCVNVPA